MHLSSDHQGLLNFSTCGLFDRPRGGSACRPLHDPGSATRAPVLWGPTGRRPERVAHGRGLQADIPMYRSSPARPRRRRQSARTAHASRAGRRRLNERAAGALQESSRLCLAAPCPAAIPRGDTPLPIPLLLSPRQAGARLPLGRHCEWVSPWLLPPSSTVEPARNVRKGAMAAPSGDCQLQWSISAFPPLSAAQHPPSRGGRGAAGEAGGNVYKQDRGVEGPGGRRGAEPAVGAAAEPMGARGARRKGGGGARGAFSARRPPGLAGARGQ